MTRRASNSHLVVTMLLFPVLAGWTIVTTPFVVAQDAEEAPVLNKDEFGLSEIDGSFSLHIAQSEKEKRIPIPTAWLVPPGTAEREEAAYVSSVKYNAQITSFAIGNGMIGLHLSSFDIMTDGSAQAAAGRDVFLVYDPRSARVEKGVPTLGVTKSRVREDGCFRATVMHFLLADIDRNGLLDLGLVEESIRCDESSSERDNSRPVQPRFVQQPVQWFIWQHRGWEAAPTLRGQFSTRFIPLPLIGMKFSPVDYVGYRYWKTHDAARWEVKSQPSALYRPPYRETLVHRTVDRATGNQEAAP